MKYRYQYNNEEEKKEIIVNNADKHLIEQQNLIEGNFLVFADEPLPTPEPTSEQRIEQLENESAMLAVELVDTQIRLDQTETEHANILLELVDKGVL